MKVKRIVALIAVFAMLITSISVSFADPTEEFHEGPLPGERKEGELEQLGPEVVEYQVFRDDKVYAPGSLLGDVDLTTVGRGLFFDGQDFYFYVDTGVMATNYMITIEGERFYFGEDGKMVRNQLVTYNGEIYFFDANGAMFKNRWYTDEQLDEVENKLVYTDYYFGPTGRAYRAMDGGRGLIVKTIEGEKYGFNVDGEKLEGYYDLNGTQLDPNVDPAYEECIYYFDPEESGAALKGWHYYEGATRGDGYGENEEIVLYFDEKTCQKVRAKVSYANEGRCISRVIEGQRYMFDHNGVRKNSWYVSEPRRASHSNVKYFSDEFDGTLQKGWFMATPGSEAANGSDLILGANKRKHANGDDCWFYAGKNGTILRKTIRKIGNYIYAFDDDGVMQEDAFVKVKNGSFIKAYETDYVTRANLLLDPNEYGGYADPDHNGPSDPIELDKKKGLINVADGERWMFFLGDYEGDTKTGSMARPNAQVKVELDDSEISFLQNNTGGYSNSELGQYSTVVNRNGTLIQNGIVLRPDKDDNNFGIVRLRVEQPPYGGVWNYRNMWIDFTTGGHQTNYYKFVVTNLQGKQVDARNKAFKDSSGYYIYVGAEGDFLGYYPYEGKFYATNAPSHMIDEDGNDIPNPRTPCWCYRKLGDKKWTYGMPPESSRVDVTYISLNFNATSTFGSGDDYGPYNYGLASTIYEEVTP